MLESESLVGRVVGNWRLTRLLGEGAFGAVYEAENSAITGRRAAVKILHPHMSVHVSIKQRFLNEASAASRADHENIIQVFDGGITADGLCYSVMELLRGSTLSEVIRRGPLDPARAVNIGTQVASALEAAHALGIVHRDLKPDNIFILQRSTNVEFVKVLDFGVAKLRAADFGGANLTSTGMMIGTPGYMSPEQWMTLPDVDGRADIYALGVILFECATGALPYSAATPYEWMRAHLEQPVPDLDRLGAVRAPLAAAIRRMMAKKREERPQTMVEVIGALQACASGPVIVPPTMLATTLPLEEARGGRSTLSGGAGEVAGGSPRRRAGRLVGLAAIAAAAVALVAWWPKAPEPAKEDPRSKVAGLVLDAEGHLKAQRWAEATAALDQALAIDPLQEVARDKRALAQAELKNKTLFESFVALADAKEIDHAVAEWALMTPESAYKKMGAGRWTDVKRLYATAHVEAAKKARAAGQCGEAKSEADLVLKQDERNLDAQEISRACASETNPFDPKGKRVHPGQ